MTQHTQQALSRQNGAKVWESYSIKEGSAPEGLSGLLKNRSRVVPGRLNRLMNALVPASLARRIEANLLGKGIGSRSASIGRSSSLARSTGRYGAG
jgi:hypothetical protein